MDKDKWFNDIEPKCDKCKVNKPGKKNVCIYQLELYDVPSECNCCNECREQCRMEV